MKKVKEINLNPGYGIADYPMHKRNRITNGGPSGPADSTYSRNVIQRVNKNMKNEEENEEEELDNFVDNVNLIKEFNFNLSNNAIDRIASLTKTGLMSIPVIGDAFAFTKFLFTIYKLRSASRKFTQNLEDLVQIPGEVKLKLGDDFLEPEGSISSESVLTTNLAEACLRLSNLEKYPELDVTMVDISSLKDKYFQLFRYCKDAIMEFIGFADVAFNQQGFYLNTAISMITYSGFPDFLFGEYSKFIDEMHLKSESFSENGLLMFFKNAAKSFLTVPRELMDFLGNLDILINPEKLERLALVHEMLEMYDDVDTNKEKYDLGLDAEPGTSYSDFLRSMKIDTSELPNPAESFKSISDTLSLNEMSMYLQETDNLNLIELYEDIEEEKEDSEEEIKEFSGGGVAGVAVPMGKKADGTTETEKEIKERLKKSNIYAEEIRKIQEWKLKTTGRIK